MHHEPTTPYSLTDADVEAYLASKREEDSIGLCAVPSACLLARVIRTKYPDAHTVDVYNDLAHFQTEHGGVCLHLSPQQCQMVATFDYGTPAEFQEHVSKRAFLEAWQGFLKSECAQALLEEG